MKYYLVGFMIVLLSSGIAALWGLVDIRWFFTVAITITVVYYIFEILGIRKCR